ncbi:phosphatidylethanolamine-binding protein 1-like [Gastrophryne carolinensis]
MPLNVHDWDGALALHEVDEKPEYPLKLTFGDTSVEELGQVLKPSQVRQRPTIHWDGMEPNALYAVAFTDPDVPSREDPTNREWHHYLAVNVKGNHLDSGHTLTKYVGSGPGKYTGLHRYTFLVYKQPGPLQCDEPILGDTSVEKREKFKTKGFRQKHKLGRPVAGMCFQAEWDESVPDLYKQLGVSV